MSIPSNDRESIKRRALKRRERGALEQFARLEIFLEELQRRLGQMLEFNFAPEERRLTSHFLFPQAGGPFIRPADTGNKVGAPAPSWFGRRGGYYERLYPRFYATRSRNEISVP